MFFSGTKRRDDPPASTVFTDLSKLSFDELIYFIESKCLCVVVRGCSLFQVFGFTKQDIVHV